MLTLENKALFFLEESYLDLDFRVTHRACGDEAYADGDHVRVLNFGLNATIIKHRITSSSGQKKDETDKAHNIFLNIY